MLIEQVKALLEKFKQDVIEQYGGMNEGLRQDFAKLDARIKELEGIVTPRKVSLPGVDLEKEKFSFFRAVWAIRFNDWSEAGFEKEVFEQTKKRAMEMGTGSLGGYIVPTEYIAQIVELLRAEAVVIRSGATVMTGLTGSPVQIPKQTGGATGYWVGENISITASDLGLNQINMVPKKVAAMVKLSNTLIKLANPSAEALVRSDIAQTLALKIDLAALRGTGSEYQPTGINIATGLKTVAVGTNGGNASFDHLIDMEYELAVDNALRGTLGYIFHPAIRRKLLKLKVAQFSGDAAGAYIIAPISETQFRNWLGYPYQMTTQVPITLTKGSGTALTEIYFGNWADLLIGQWGGMELMASKETSDAFEKDQTWVRILQELDIATRHGQSFCLINDAASA
jgi:HK97 family phage major capsid protein